MSLDRMLTVDEVAEVFRLHPQTVYKWEYEGRLPSIRIGGAIRFRESTLLKWMEEQEKRGGQHDDCTRTNGHRTAERRN